MAPPSKSIKGKVSIAPPAQRRQTLTPTKKQFETDKTYLPAVIPENNPYRLAFSQLSPYDITLPSMSPFEFIEEFKKLPKERQKQFLDGLTEKQLERIPGQASDYGPSNGGSFPYERLPELVAIKRKITRYQDPIDFLDISLNKLFNKNQSTLNEKIDSNALTNQEEYRYTPNKGNKITEDSTSSENSPITNLPFPRWLSIHPSTPLPSSRSAKRQPYTIGEPMRYPGRYITYDLPTYDVSGTFNPKLTDAKVGAGALTGLGVLAYPYLFSDNNEETLSEVPQKQSVIKSVSEPTLEQRYVSQGKPYDSRPPQSYPVEEDLDIHSNTPVETSSDNFTAPRELPANGETLDEYNSDSIPKSGVVLASDDTTSANEPRVLNKPTNTRKPIIVNKPQKQVTPAPTPVSAESALVQNALSKEDLAKRDRAFRNARYAALNANLAGREDALQRARYQSLMNSGLRGMSPSEAIKSGLLTPEQAYVLMRGPF